MAANTVVTTRTRPSTKRTARVARAPAPGRRQPSGDAALAVGVLREHRPRRAQPARAHRERPVLGIAEDRCRRPGLGVLGQQKGAGRQPGDAQHRRRRCACRRPRPSRRAPCRCRRAARSCRPARRRHALVTTSPFRRSSRSRRRSARTPSRARARRGARGGHLRVAGDRRAGSGTVAEGPSMLGTGSKRASALKSGPDGGSSSLSEAQRRGPLDLRAQRRAHARRLERHGADHAAPAPPRSPAQPLPPRRRCRAPARPAAGASRGPAPRAAPSTSPPTSAPTSPNSGA